MVRFVKLGGFDLMVLTDTKIFMREYCWNWIIYYIFCLPAWTASSSGYQGGMRLVSQECQMVWSLELMHFHVPNVVSCVVVIGASWTLIVVAYLLMSTMGQPLDLEEAMARFQGQDPILLVDLNVDLDEAQTHAASPLRTC